MLAVAVPLVSVPLSALIVIVRTCVVPTGFVATGGVIWMFALTTFVLPPVWTTWGPVGQLTLLSQSERQVNETWSFSR
jgi:hypothetical protein